MRTLTVGQNLSVLDLYLSANGSAVSGVYVGFELFDAANTSALSGISVNLNLGQYTASGVLPANYSLGTWRIDWDIITASNNVVFASENFIVKEIDVATGFVPPSDITFAIYDSIRIDIGDPTGTIFTDDFLERVVTKAVRRLNQRLGLDRVRSYIPHCRSRRVGRMPKIEFDANSGTLTPSNDEIHDLVILQSEVIIYDSEVAALKRLDTTAGTPYTSAMTSASNEGVSVTNADQVSISVSPGRFSSRATLYKSSADAARNELNMAINAILGRMTGDMGVIIV